MLMPIFLMKMVATLVGQAMTNKLRRYKPTAREAAEMAIKPTKGALQSKTVQGVAVLGLGPIIAGWLGIEGGLVVEIIQWAGAGWALWGRYKAEKAIG